MIIAILLLSLIALSASVAIRIGLKSYEKAGAAFKNLKSKTLNTVFLFDQLKLTCKYKWKGENYSLFEGENDELLFISKKSILNPSRYGFFKVKYKIEENKLLVSEEQILDPSEVNREFKKEATVFIKNFRSLSFKYYDGKNWNDTWHHSNLPEAIYLEINWNLDKKTQMIIPILIDRNLRPVQ